MEDSSVTGIESSSGVFGIPKWMMKKGMRYEVDDFIVSPPSNEEGGFFHLRYGRMPSSRTRSSIHDSANQEMAMTVEVRDGDTVITGMSSSEHLGNIDPSTLVITASGLSTPTTPVSSPEVIPENQAVQPLLVLNLRDSKSAAIDEASKASADSANTKLLVLSEDLPLSGSHASIEERFQEVLLSEAGSSQIKSRPEPSEAGSSSQIKTRPELAMRINLVEKVQTVPIITSPEKNLGITSLTPLPSPLTTPQTSPHAQRKVMGVVMERTNKSTSHSYFCTKPFQGNQQQISSTKPGMSQEAGQVSLSSSSSVMTQQLEDRTKASQSLESDTKLSAGKRRQKPKPSSLREMNFWAPTSM
ncbi:uncharacterized protein LOC121856484 [Homarus americanus]|uniref:uncharacterized protein LOC121856484 n=1 Tax=Homarus americanus TaxID=6706 RepID=UPI001C446DFE|nr:uncharacterized protein LOC121856484 [Homarus americanus]